MKKTKRLPFDKIFTSLGVEVDLSKSVQGEISVQNKPGRVDAIRVSVSKIVKSDYLGFKDALSTRGRVAYTEGQLFGRVAAPLCSSPRFGGTIWKVASIPEASTIGGERCTSRSKAAACWIT